MVKKLLVATLVISIIQNYSIAQDKTQKEQKKDEQDPKKQDKKKETSGYEPIEFFNIPTKALKVIYVIDISGSMKAPLNMKEKELEIFSNQKSKDKKETLDSKAPKEVKELYSKFDPKLIVTRLDALKVELAKSIYNLDEKASFTIIVFSNDAKEWPKGLVKATWSNKHEALKLAYNLYTHGSTALFDGLDLAFKHAKPRDKKSDKPEPNEEGKNKTTQEEIPPEELTAIYLLSDGIPNRGKFVWPAKMVPKGSSPLMLDEAYKWIEGECKRLKVVLHTIALGDEIPGFFSDILKKMADLGKGEFRRVPEGKTKEKEDKNQKKNKPKGF